MAGAGGGGGIERSQYRTAEGGHSRFGRKDHSHSEVVVKGRSHRSNLVGFVLEENKLIASQMVQ